MKKALLFILLSLLLAGSVFSVPQRFPKPEFDSGYTQPDPTRPTPRSLVEEYLDVFVLVIALSLASWLAVKKRSRKGIFVLSLFSLVYFGFIRHGCVCSVGSVQNITLAFFDNSYMIPATVVLFFVLPLLFTLFWGRTFCAAVCPLGALQDVTALSPRKIPGWLNNVLGLIPYLYLGTAILFTATGAGFIICRFDPYIGIFRQGVNQNMFIFTAFIFITGIFIARPYCRYMCPYSVLLKWMSILSKRHVTITPDKCIQCHLCTDSCPFDVIDKPTPDKYPGIVQNSRKQLLILLILLPIVVFMGGWSVSQLSVILSKSHYMVQVAEQVKLEDEGKIDFTTDASKAFRGTGMPVSELYTRAAEVQQKFKTGSWLLGMFISLIVMIKMINLTIWRKRNDYTPNKGGCYSCARCIDFCPVEHDRIHALKGDSAIE